MQPKIKEKDLQKGIADYLRLMGYLVVKFPSVGTYNRKTDRYIPMARRGVSDLLFWGRGKFGAVECKVRPNKPTDEQLEFGKDMEKAGGVFIIAYTLEDIMK